jgi:hypothetical protein
MNCADGIFENSTKIISKFVWIHFHNPQIGHNTWIKNLSWIPKAWQTIDTNWK